MEVKLFPQRRSLRVTMLPFLLCLSVMTIATLAYGQAATGRLSGTVSGPDGLISNATVVVTDNQTEQSHTAATNAQGAFSFPQLVAHAARTRRLCAGTIIGSGTVSNENYREVGSSCIAERRGIETVDLGEARTPYMRFGDTVRMEAQLADGTPLFGAIEQRVVQAPVP